MRRLARGWNLAHMVAQVLFHSLAWRVYSAFSSGGAWLATIGSAYRRVPATTQSRSAQVTLVSALSASPARNALTHGVRQFWRVGGSSSRNRPVDGVDKLSPASSPLTPH